MAYFLMILMAAGIIAADQLSKLWVVNNIASSVCRDAAACAGHIETMKTAYHLTEEELSTLPHSIDGVDEVFHLSHVHNTGAAWSSFQGMHWLFALVFVVFTVAVVWEFSKKRWGFTTFERWCIAAVWAGGMGNMIDRLRLGYVVDMIAVDFMNFPVFNVADCFITCGCIALIGHLIFFNKGFWKDNKKASP